MKIITKKDIKENWLAKQLIEDGEEEILKHWIYFKEMDSMYPFEKIKEYLVKKDIMVLEYKYPSNPELINGSAKHDALQRAGFVGETYFTIDRWHKNRGIERDTVNNNYDEFLSIKNFITKPLYDLDPQKYEQKLKKIFEISK